MKPRVETYADRLEAEDVRRVHEEAQIRKGNPERARLRALLRIGSNLDRLACVLERNRLDRLAVQDAEDEDLERPRPFLVTDIGLPDPAVETAEEDEPPLADPA